MVFLELSSITGYKPRPDFSIRIEEDGKVWYTGRYYVGEPGERHIRLKNAEMEQIKLLVDFLERRNKKNYLKKNLNPAYRIKIGVHTSNQIEVDENDVVSADVIDQIIELTGAHSWLNAQLDLFLVMTRPAIRSKELSVLRAITPEKAITTFLEDRRSSAYKSMDDYLAIKLGYQEAGTLINPVTYFSFSEYMIQDRTPELFLNQGPHLKTDGSKLKVYFYISFGKRYNDPGASYFMVVAGDKEQAIQLFRSAYSHFMPRDFQQVDPGVIYKSNPLFTTHIPIAIR